MFIRKIFLLDFNIKSIIFNKQNEVASNKIKMRKIFKVV